MLGLDFGTTNSAIATARADGSTRLAEFTLDGQPTTTFRSVLYFNPDDNTFGRRPGAVTGPQAIEAYRDAGAGAGGRFIQALKSFLASRLFEGTSIFGWTFTLEDLVAIILNALRNAAAQQFGVADGRVLIGRPVHFVLGGSGEVDPERDETALERLRSAAARAGFDEVAFEYERSLPPTSTSAASTTTSSCSSAISAAGPVISASSVSVPRRGAKPTAAAPFSASTACR